MTTTATAIIRRAFEEPHHADQHDPDLVRAAVPPVRRRRRDLHLPLPRPLAARLGLRLDPRLIAACSALPAAWTVAMIALAWSLRY